MILSDNPDFLLDFNHKSLLWRIIDNAVHVTYAMSPITPNFGVWGQTSSLRKVLN